MKMSDEVYQLLRTVPKGRVTTYKAIAEKLGSKAYRAVGQVLRKNPYAPVVPCHRVVSTNGTIGGFMGKREEDEIEKKIGLLKSEGVEVAYGKVIDFKTKVFIFES
jgi:methylated-DNA-[protein]-cysteine S-methyltransferase